MKGKLSNNKELEEEIKLYLKVQQYLNKNNKVDTVFIKNLKTDDNGNFITFYFSFDDENYNFGAVVKPMLNDKKNILKYNLKLIQNDYK